MLIDAAYPIENSLNYPDNLIAQNEGSSVVILFDAVSKYATLWYEFVFGLSVHWIGCVLANQSSEQAIFPIEGKGVPGKALIFVVEKP